MNISEAKTLVASLLDEETADEFEHKLPAFYDYAQKQIATTVDYIKKDITLVPDKTADTDIAELVKTRIGKRLYKLRKITSDDSFEHLHDNFYRFYAGGEYIISCCVYPDTIDKETPPEYEFEVSPEAQPAIVYYAAAQTVITDTDQRPYYAFMDRYNNILQNINDARRDNITVRAVVL